MQQFLLPQEKVIAKRHRRNVNSSLGRRSYWNSDCTVDVSMYRCHSPAVGDLSWDQNIASHFARILHQRIRKNRQTMKNIHEKEAFRIPILNYPVICPTSDNILTSTMCAMMFHANKFF